MGSLLSSWRDGSTKSTIVDFVERVSAPNSPDFVAVPERVAVFDNDGTLWCEKPMPIQLEFTIGRLRELAAADPALRTRQPWRAAYHRDVRWLDAAMVKHYHGDDAELKLLMAAVTRAFDAVTVEDYAAQVREFFVSTAHPTLDRPYRECGYRPMVELLRYLEGHGFTTYIVSGGDRDFMRSIADTLYGIPPERVIGSALGLSYRDRADGTDLLYKATMDFFDDGPEKPVRIWSRIGRRPILSVGNSTGDLPMLAFSGLPQQPSLRIVLRHDDAEREFDYTAGAENVLDAAAKHDWTVVSMKNDWTTVFPPHPQE